MMKNLQNYKAAISFGGDTAIINEDIFKKLLENGFHVLIQAKEIHVTNNLYNSKPEAIKEFYASLLSVITEFARYSANKDEIVYFLHDQCGWPSERTNLFIETFERNKQRLEIVLLNIGTALPHISDIKWKIDYIVKSSEVHSSEGPIFRICLVGEQFDLETESKILKNIQFSCNSMELLDLICKLKDALRHCNTVTRVF